jgi:Bacterial aa3 type cytochrome c oxidase subunit IV
MASANDMKAHNGTYEGFISLLKVSIPVLAIITAVVIALIA